MKVRLRFVIILTFVVACIFACAIFIMYLLSANARKDDFAKRLQAIALSEYIKHYNIRIVNKDTAAFLSTYSRLLPSQLSVSIFDEYGRAVFSLSPEKKIKTDTAVLQKIKAAKDYFYFKNDSTESIGIYINEYQPKGYVIASAHDKFGVMRLQRLKYIMFFVALGAVILIGAFSFFLVVQTTKPLVKLSLQMRSITEGNLSERFKIGKGNIKNNEFVQISTNFNNMLDRLSHAFEMQKSFVHHASHELRTPLANMLAQTESALRREFSLEEAKEILQSLKEDQQELIELTNSLLLLSQYEKIYYTPEWPEVRIDEVLYDTIAAVKKIFPNISLSLEFVRMPENELSISIHGNDTLLRSAFRNLIKNAYQYSEDRHVTITIAADEKEISVAISNAGKTLNKEDTARLFIPFFRGPNSQRKRGFGLGLSIVKRIVTLHQGKITYHSIDDHTNCFTLTFKK